MKAELHPHVAALMKKHARELAQITPSDSLDARIGRMVAASPKEFASGPSPSRPVRRGHRPLAWAAAAALAVLAIGAGILIGVRLERASSVAAVNSMAREAARQAAWAPEDLGMWPSDSVALTIPAEYSAQGTLVAVKPDAATRGQRYWIDVVVSNDGTVRIERIVPAEDSRKQVEPDGVALQRP